MFIFIKCMMCMMSRALGRGILGMVKKIPRGFLYFIVIFNFYQQVFLKKKMLESPLEKNKMRLDKTRRDKTKM